MSDTAFNDAAAVVSFGASFYHLLTLYPNQDGCLPFLVKYQWVLRDRWPHFNEGPVNYV